DEGAEALLDTLRVLPADEAERHFRARLSRQHGLGALSRIAADDAVELASRARPKLLQHRAPALAGGDRQADVAEEFLRIEFEIVPLRGDLLRQFFDAVVE